jgi:hypothetical protein
MNNEEIDQLKIYKTKKYFFLSSIVLLDGFNIPYCVNIDGSISIRVLLFDNNHCHRFNVGLYIPLVQKSRAKPRTIKAGINCC